MPGLTNRQQEIEAAEARIEAMSTDELLALIDEVRGLPPSEWTEDQLRAADEIEQRSEQEAGEGPVPETMREAQRRGLGSVSISMRWPVELLDQVRAEADRRGVPYQRLIREMVEFALAQSGGNVMRMELGSEQLDRLEQGGSVVLEVHGAVAGSGGIRTEDSGR